MDDKTEELRDIFMDVAEEGTVTEQQTEGHGSLADVDEADVDERLAEVISEMHDRYTFETDLDDAVYTEVVRGFYEGREDELLAEQLDLDTETVFAARMDLHLIAGSDEDAPLDMTALRDAIADDEADAAALAERLDADAETVAHYRQVAAAQNAARRASHRFQSAFEDALADANLSVHLTADVQDDGLEDATEDIETDVSF